MAKYVKWKGGMEWDFDDLHSAKIAPKFKDLIGEYLQEHYEQRVQALSGAQVC